MDHYYAVIMAGGGGTRLWPLSRKDRPKQSLKLLGDRTMFQLSVERLTPLFSPERILVVTSAAYAADLHRQCPSLPEANFVLEPAPKGTAPAIALSALAIRRRDPGGLMASLTADHFIGDEARFRDVLAAAAQVAGKGFLVTLGSNRPILRPAMGTSSAAWRCKPSASGKCTGLHASKRSPNCPRPKP